MTLVVLLIPHRAAAQSSSPPIGDAASGEQRWQPLGQLPVDQAGAGLRGYALPVEGADVAIGGENQVAIHTVVANNFYREQNDDFLVGVRYETHALALGFRHGFGTRRPFELGGQLQLVERDGGFMNGFISGFEDFWAAIVGQSANIQMRSSLTTPPPPGTLVARNGRSIYRAPGTGSGFGDFSLVAKVLVAGGAS